MFLEKGISSIKNIDLRDSYSKEMNKLEEKSEIREEYHFGYGQSESLISMIKIPNNSFPIFWYEKSPYAIFKRPLNDK